MMDDLSQFRDTYFAECAELLRDLETQLAALDEGTADSECLHSIFRAVHSIKAGAGVFKFTVLVDFSHKFEALLDFMRDGRIEASKDNVSLLFRANDVLADLIEIAERGEEPPVEEAEAISVELVAATQRGEGMAVEAQDEPLASLPEGAPRSEGPATYRIAFKPAAQLFQHANEPLLIVRELKSLGELKIVADLSRVPELPQLDPEEAYLAWTFTLTTEAGRSAVEEAFEFVLDDCELEIEQIGESGVSPETPPHTDAAAVGGQSRGAPETPQAGAASQAGGPADSAPRQGARVSSIRVDLDRIDRLVNMVGELVITQSMLSQQTHDLPTEHLPRFARGLEELALHTRELQESVMAIRMQPVKSVFARMPRLVRDLSSKLGKQVRLVTIGEDTEVDKTVIEEISDPITHMIRNSLDHGLETIEERATAGKPADGTITLAAEHRGGRIVITIKDDGRGIDRAKVLARAIERGILPAEANPSDEEIENLLFAPGFSTAAAVTDISGRGVGLDVVRRNIQGLGGRVSVASNPGHGTCFTMTLPLTLAVMDGMIVVVGKDKYVIPITNIVESIRPTRQQVHRLPNGDQLVEVRGEYVHLVHIARAFNVAGAVSDPSKGLVVLAETEGRGKVGLLVDGLLGQQQVVIKSLEANYDPVPGISAATILGNGLVAPILDIEGLQAMPPSAHPPAGDGRSRTETKPAAKAA